MFVVIVNTEAGRFFVHRAKGGNVLIPTDEGAVIYQSRKNANRCAERYLIQTEALGPLTSYVTLINQLQCF